MDLIITEFTSRYNSDGKIVHTTWEDLVNKLRHPVITEESLDEYALMTNEEKTDAKDVGGYVAGELENGKRKKEYLKSRCVLTIDADEATSNDIDDFDFYDKPWMYCVHSTHTSTVENPRLRWLFLLSRPVNSNEYRRLINYVSKFVGTNTLDETTDQPERLMFWPSVSWDADYTFVTGGTDPLDVDATLEQCPEVEDIPKRTSEIKSDDGLLEVGQRNDAIFRYACKQRSEGLDGEALYKIVDIYNQASCRVPLPTSEIRAIVKQAQNYKRGDVVPVDLRLPENDFSDIGEVKRRRKKEAASLEYESQLDLVNRYIPPPSYIIDGLLPIGLGVIVAPPKSKKSWFCLDLAMAVANGVPFLDLETNKHDVAYFTLEDYDYRLKGRSIKVQKDGHTNFAPNLFFIKKAPDVQHGFFDKLEEFLQKEPKVKLVIIDTLKKVFGKSDGKDNAYNEDYDRLTPFQDFAIDHDIAILLVHHTRKGKDTGDFANNVSGSLGINATMDVMMFFNKKNRKDDQTELEVVGRDDRDKTFIIRFDDEKCRWINMGEEKEVRESEAETKYRNDPVVKTIKFYLDQAKDLVGEGADSVSWRVTAQGLLDAVEKENHGSGYKSSNAVGMHLVEVQDLLSKIDGISVTKAHVKAGNEYVFTRPP